MRYTNGVMAQRLRGFARKQYSLITGINRKYAQPRIRMSRWVRLSLLLLRLYLIFLVLLLGYRFWTLLP
jgi:hypothetical protein